MSLTLEVGTSLLAHHSHTAQANRQRFKAHNVVALNLMSSPGAGKTTLLVQTLLALKSQAVSAAVIEGDQATELDARRIRSTGAPVHQVNTGRACHLEAEMVAEAWHKLNWAGPGLLFIENVGNLICPAAFELGESARVVLVSTTEGEDKPLKYSGMFASADLVLVTKTDLLPHLSLDLTRLETNLRCVAPRAPILWTSSRSEGGLAPWLEWLTRAPKSAEKSYGIG